MNKKSLHLANHLGMQFTQERLLVGFSAGQDSMSLLVLLFVVQLSSLLVLHLLWNNHLWHKNSLFINKHVFQLGFWLELPTHNVVGLPPTPSYPFRVRHGENLCATFENQHGLAWAKTLSCAKLSTHWVRYPTGVTCAALLPGVAKQHKAYNEKKTRNTELQARQWRQRTARRLHNYHRCQRFVQAHTGSDRVETLLLNMVRGTGKSSFLESTKNQNIFSQKHTKHLLLEATWLE